MTKLPSTVSPSKYGSLYREHAFRQYEHYLASIDKIGDRRQDANHYFLSITTGLVTLIGLSFQLEATTALNWARISLAMIGLLICLVFWHLLYSYRQLLRGKFKIVYALEEQLPFEISKHEWHALGEGKKRTVYLPFSHTELIIPWVLGLIYICTILFLILSN